MPKIDGRADSIGSARSACSFIQDQLSLLWRQREIQPLISPKLLLEPDFQPFCAFCLMTRSPDLRKIMLQRMVPASSLIFPSPISVE
jgi:hypothetical protein